MRKNDEEDAIERKRGEETMQEGARADSKVRIECMGWRRGDGIHFLLACLFVPGVGAGKLLNFLAHARIDPRKFTHPYTAK